MNVGKIQLLQGFHGFRKTLVRLAGKAEDKVRRDCETAYFLVKPANQINILFSRIAAVHSA